MTATVEIVPLSAADTAALSAVLSAQHRDYLAHFRPFAFDEQTIAAQLAAAIQDRFWTLRTDGAIAGFFMLRGWDAGFARPAFGVFVAEEFSGRGFARKALDFAIEYCRHRDTRALILTAHPENHSALRIYQAAGFRPTGERSPQDDDIYELPL